MPDNKDRFRVVLTEHAIADLEDISIESQEQIHSGLKSLESNPFPHTGSTKRLKGFRPLREIS